MDHIGIDVHKRESQVCIVTAQGELIERRIPTTPTALAGLLCPRPSAKILLEASTESEWVARCLERLGHSVILGDPNFAPMYATRSRRVKTDRRDARALCEAAVLGAYRAAHRLSDAQRHVRARLAVHDTLVRTRTRYIALIRALLRQHGWRLRPGQAEHIAARVLALRVPGRLLSEIAPLLAVIQHVNRQLAYTDRAIAHSTRPDARVQRLQTLPYIGPVTAAAFVATLDDAARFRDAHQVAAYLGLVPANSAPAKPSAAAASPRPAMSASAGCSSRRRTPSAARATRASPPWRRGPLASPRAAARRSRPSPWPGASPASCTPCCAMALTMRPSRAPVGALNAPPLNAVWA
jgi:transposase